MLWIPEVLFISFQKKKKPKHQWNLKNISSSNLIYGPPKMELRIELEILVFNFYIQFLDLDR